jgi:hypothetical protein
MSARPGLYGGQPVMVVPTVINSYSVMLSCHCAIMELRVTGVMGRVRSKGDFTSVMVVLDGKMKLHAL